MSLNKAIQSGKERRRPYRGSKRFDSSCRNHGGCPHCEEGRLRKRRMERDVEREEEEARGEE
jgi:hypothetical protein